MMKSRLARHHAFEDPVHVFASALKMDFGCCWWLDTAPAHGIASPTLFDISKFLVRYHYSNLNLGSCRRFDIAAITGLHSDTIAEISDCFCFHHQSIWRFHLGFLPTFTAGLSTPSRTLRSEDFSLVL